MSVQALPILPDVQVLDVAKPPRLNFAGYCGWCCDRYCTSPVCEARWAASCWAPCDHCGGAMVTPDGLSCGLCLYGVMEIAPASATRQR